MSTYKTFAIVGFGYTGSLFANHFARHNNGLNLKWKILSRSIEKAELREAESQGAELVSVDYSSQASLIKALEGVDVALSTLRDEGLEDVQLNLVRAAKAAGVKLFVPSEYGRNTLGITAPCTLRPLRAMEDRLKKYFSDLKPKADTQALLKELELPYALFFTGLWPSMLLDPAISNVLGIDFETGKFTFFGDGNAKQSWTAPVDFVAFVYHLFTTCPPSELENQVFQIEGDVKSLREVIALWERKTGKKAEFYERSEEEIQDFIAAQDMELYRFLPHQLKYGGLKVTGESNKLWPEWNPSESRWEDIFA